MSGRATGGYPSASTSGVASRRLGAGSGSVSSDRRPGALLRVICFIAIMGDFPNDREIPFL